MQEPEEEICVQEPEEEISVQRAKPEEEICVQEPEDEIEILLSCFRVKNEREMQKVAEVGGR